MLRSTEVVGTTRRRSTRAYGSGVIDFVRSQLPNGGLTRFFIDVFLVKILVTIKIVNS